MGKTLNCIFVNHLWQFLSLCCQSTDSFLVCTKGLRHHQLLSRTANCSCSAPGTTGTSVSTSQTGAPRCGGLGRPSLCPSGRTRRARIRGTQRRERGVFPTEVRGRWRRRHSQSIWVAGAADQRERKTSPAPGWDG